MNKCKRNFTLIELLVIVSILGILLSLLLPSIGRAKEESMKVVCKSNLKQMHVGVMLHVKNTQYLPYAANRNYYQSTWIWSISELLDLPAVKRPSRAESNLFLCPKNETPHKVSNTSYAYNYLCGFLAKGIRWNPIMLQKVSNPSAAVLIGDQPSPYFGNGLFNSNLVHVNKKQALLLDGSVQSLASPQQNSLDPDRPDYWYFWALSNGS